MIFDGHHKAPGGLQEWERGEEPGLVHTGALRVLQSAGEKHGLGLDHPQLGLPGWQVSGLLAFNLSFTPN